jgi:hypothetical protein
MWLAIGVLVLSAGGLVATAVVPSLTVLLYGWFLLLGVIVYAIFHGVECNHDRVFRRGVQREFVRGDADCRVARWGRRATGVRVGD